MNAQAMLWVDDVFPRVATRQWVMTVPWGRRWLFARKPHLARGVLKIGLRAVFGRYKKWARKKGLVDIQCGSVTAVQRFGSALNLNVHFHALVMDGVYAKDPKRGGGFQFFRAPSLKTEEVEALVLKIAMKSEKWLTKMGYPDGRDVDLDPDDALPLLHSNRSTSCH